MNKKNGTAGKRKEERQAQKAGAKAGKALKKTKSRQQYPYEVFIGFLRLRKKKRRPKLEKRSINATEYIEENGGKLDRVKRGTIDKKSIKLNRACVGTLVSRRFVLTTTSCCRYCLTIWKRKFRKRQQTTQSHLYTRRKRDTSDGAGRGLQRSSSS
ncbi:hypothetical protein C7M84_011979 [Penaeus vannamei]|uniref:Uncharacterized protein n=1 Tax=Penaeus vannamei TaxID=6689 RepID=A0A3R7MU75_PENVA|nr:hypothetical protein C7M84_011979 [Penaeus vannamei]